MPSGLELLAKAKTIASAIGGIASAVRTYTAIRKWVDAKQAQRMQRLARTLDEPHRRAIPHLKRQLLRFLSEADRLHELEELSRNQAPDVTQHVEFLTRSLHLPESMEGDRSAIARELMEHLLRELRVQLLISPSGLAVAEGLATERHEQVNAGIRGLQDLLETRLPDQIMARFERFEQSAKGRSPGEALAIWELAERELTQGQTSVEVLSSVHRRLGGAYWNVGRLDKATEHYSKSWVLAPQNTSAQIGQVLALGLRGQHQDAEAMARQIVASGEATSNAKVALGQVLLWAGKHQALKDEIAPLIGDPSVDLEHQKNAGNRSPAQLTSAS